MIMYKKLPRPSSDGVDMTREWPTGNGRGRGDEVGVTQRAIDLLPPLADLTRKTGPRRRRCKNVVPRSSRTGRRRSGDDGHHMQEPPGCICMRLVRSDRLRRYFSISPRLTHRNAWDAPHRPGLHRDSSAPCRALPPIHPTTDQSHSIPCGPKLEDQPP